jgi:hypothetical protein
MIPYFFKVPPKFLVYQKSQVANLNFILQENKAEMCNRLKNLTVVIIITII